MSANALLRALQPLLPDAAMSVIHERPWHSLTFAGRQICLSVKMYGEKHADIAANFAAMLPEQEFKMKDLLVADIAVSETVASEAGIRLTIDALLLDD